MVHIIWKHKSNFTENLEGLQLKLKGRFTRVNSLCNINKKVEGTWLNKLFWGDNKEVLLYLLNNFEEKIDLIYVDPPFFSGTNYKIEVEGLDELYYDTAYLDHWEKDLDSYLQMLYERIILFQKLLSDKGLLFIHLDWHASHYIRLILDEVFGQNRFVNNIIWYYYNKYSAGKKNLPRAHDDIIVYSKTENYTFNELRIPRKTPRKQLKREMVNGILKNVKDDNGHVVYRIVTDKKLDDVWKIPCMQPASKEWTGYPTQKHHDLLERIIRLGSNEGDLVADFFCGSGTTLLAAEKLNRKWIGCDLSEYSIYLTLKRIKEISSQSYEMLTFLTEKRKMLIESGFFQKKLKVKRKK
ncbi:MAG: DNA methyltransferase [Candidatus Hermodarchaeota archaeon]